VNGVYSHHIGHVDDWLSDVTIVATNDAAAARLTDDVTLGRRHRQEVVKHDYRKLVRACLYEYCVSPSPTTAAVNNKRFSCRRGTARRSVLLKMLAIVSGCMMINNDVFTDTVNVILSVALTYIIGLQFLANVNSRSRSLYAIAVPSLVCLSVCRL